MQMNAISHPELPHDDGRFRALVGITAWKTLSPAIRKRFGKRVKGGESVAYQGTVTAMKMNWAGHILAQVLRLVGAPLPYDISCVGQPAVVVVTEDIGGDGQFWVRQYGRRLGFPQVVHSSKRFAGPTGLEEYIGCGIGMALGVEAHGDALLFKSDHYFIAAFGRRIRLPKALSPGALVVGHHDLGQGAFRFSMCLTSAVFGELLCQDAQFRDS